MDNRDLDTSVPVPDELDLTAQDQDAPGGAPELESLLGGRFFTIGVGGAVSAWSARAESTFGFTNAAIVGQTFVAKLLAAAERVRRGEEIEALLLNEGPPVALHIETRAMNSSGVEFDERFAVVPIRLLDGYELNGLLQDLAKFRRADDRPRLEKSHARILSVLDAELTGRVIERTEDGEEDQGEEAERLVGALVIFEGEGAPPIAPEGVDEETGEPKTSEDELVAARHQIDKLRFEVEQAHRQAANALHDAELAREEVEQTRARLNDVRGSADEEQGRAQQLLEEAAQAKSAAEAAEAALEEAHARAGEAEAELEGVRAELAEAVQRAEELENLRSELAEAVQRREQLESELGQVQSAFGEVQEALGEVQGELDAAHASGTEQGEALRRELEDARAARDEATSKLAEMEGELTELTSHQDELASELDAKRTELAEVASRRDELAGKLDSTGADLAELAAKRGELAEELEAKRAELAEVAGRRDELAAALDSKEQELGEATSARDELAAAVEAKEAELEAARASESEQAETLRAQLEETRGERDVLAEAVEALTSEVSDLTTRRNELSSELEAKDAELEAARSSEGEHIQELTAKVEELTAEHERLADELGRREQELADARAAAEEAKGDADRRQARVDELAEALQEAQQRTERAQADAERAAGELEAANASAEEARFQAKGAIGELDEARRQVDLFRGAFDTAPIGMALTATDGRFVKVNRTLCRQLGYAEEQLLSDDPPSIVHPDDVEANREMARRLIAGEIETSRAERRYVHADGHEIHMRESVALVRGGDGAPLLFIFQLEDNTEPIELAAPDESFTLGSASGSLPVHLGDTAAVPAVGVEGPFLPPERVRQALEDDQFVLYCQPVLDLRTNQIGQYELLARIVDEDGRLILPQAFLKPAEQSGLIRSIDHWVVRRAVRLIAENAQAGRDVRIEVNVSPESLTDRELLTVLDQELAATPVSPSNLVVEITESAAVANPEGASALAKGVRGLGARFALDDFGSTFGSFRHLKDLPLDYLKIDGDLVSSLTESRTSQLVVKALVDVARGTGTETIAVFVPDQETLMLLRQHGVGFAQGYVVGRPQPLSEVFADGRAALPPAG